MAIETIKVGQKYRVLKNNSGHTATIGSEVIVTTVRGPSSFYYNYGTYWITLGEVTLIEDIKNITKTQMNIKEKFALAFKSEPEKSFRIAGITNGDDFLTEDGQKIFLSWLLKKYGNDFKKEVVDELLKKEDDK